MDTTKSEILDLIMREVHSISEELEHMEVNDYTHLTHYKMLRKERKILFRTAKRLTALYRR